MVSTSAEGKFELTNIHSDAQFVFASKPGTIDTGCPIARGEDARLVLRKESEAIDAPVQLKWQPSAESKKALAEHFAFVRKATKASRYSTTAMVDATMRTDSGQLPQLLPSLGLSLIHI